MLGQRVPVFANRPPKGGMAELWKVIKTSGIVYPERAYGQKADKSRETVDI